MALEDLLASLEREAEARARAILAEAGAEAETVEAEATRRLAGRRERRLARREDELREELEQELAVERRDARAAILRARDDLLERTFAAAAARLEGPEEAEARRRSLPKRLGEALAFVDGPALLECGPETETELREALDRREGVTVTPGPGLGGGFVVRATDGRVEIDERLAARLRRARERLAVEVMKRVRGAAEGDGEEQP